MGAELVAARLARATRVTVLTGAVVWFGEPIPPAGRRAASDATACDLFLSIGTSSVVYPAAGLVAEARARGAFTVEINPMTTQAAVDVAIALPAEEALASLGNVVRGQS